MWGTGLATVAGPGRGTRRLDVLGPVPNGQVPLQQLTHLLQGLAHPHQGLRALAGDQSESQGDPAEPGQAHPGADVGHQSLRRIREGPQVQIQDGEPPHVVEEVVAYEPGADHWVWLWGHPVQSQRLQGGSQGLPQGAQVRCTATTQKKVPKKNHVVAVAGRDSAPG